MMNADVMLPGHTFPISGEAEVQRILGMYRDAMLFVHERTAALINQGVGTAKDMAPLVKLPDDLAGEPYLQEFCADIPSAVRSIL